MTKEQVEHVARAFYEAEHPHDWEDAPGAIRQHFRDLARLAIATLNLQIRDCQTARIAGEPDVLLASF